MPDDKYSAYAGAEPYFALVRKALADLVAVPHPVFPAERSRFDVLAHGVPPPRGSAVLLAYHAG